MKNVVVLVGALLLAAAAPAQAQMMQWQDRGFVNVNGLFQPVSRDVDVSGTFSLYNQTATFVGPREIGSGAVLDLSGGMRVWRNLAIGVGYSRFSNSGDMSVTASIPDPLVFNQPNVQTLNVSGLDHTENAIHLSAVWFWPFTDKIDIAASAGPSFFFVSSTSVDTVEVQTNTSIATGATTVDADESGVGVNLGLDVTYLVTPRIGAGVLLRFAGASVDLPAAEGADVGGFQVGAGVRVRF